MLPVHDFCLSLLDGLIIPFFLLIHRSVVLCINGLKTRDCEIKESFPLKVFLGGVGGGTWMRGPLCSTEISCERTSPALPRAVATCLHQFIINTHMHSK